jgi:hypothetical protein
MRTNAAERAYSLLFSAIRELFSSQKDIFETEEESCVNSSSSGESGSRKEIKTAAVAKPPTSKIVISSSPETLQQPIDEVEGTESGAF